jgi:hypothetical protein
MLLLPIHRLGPTTIDSSRPLHRDLRHWRWKEGPYQHNNTTAGDDDGDDDDDDDDDDDEQKLRAIATPTPTPPTRRRENRDDTITCSDIRWCTTADRPAAIARGVVQSKRKHNRVAVRQQHKVRELAAHRPSESCNDSRPRTVTIDHCRTVNSSE